MGDLTKEALDLIEAQAEAHRYAVVGGCRTDVRLEDVRALVAEVRRLRGQTDELRRVLREAHQREMVLEELACPGAFVR